MILALGCGSDDSSGDAGGSTTTSTSSGDGGGSACEDPADPPVFEVGTGEDCFTRLASGQTVPVMQGPQGGFHLWLAVGCADCGTPAIVRYGVKDPATGDWYAGTSLQEAVIELDPAGWGQSAGQTAFLPGVVYDSTTQLPKGTHVLLAAAMLDMAMAIKHEGEVEVVLGETKIWSPPCDENPMTCGAPGGTPCCTLGK